MLEDLVVNARMTDQISRKLRDIRQGMRATRREADDNKKSMKDWDRENRNWTRGLTRVMQQTDGFNKLLKALKIPAIITGVRLLATAFKGLSASIVQAVGSMVPLFGILAALPAVIASLLTTMGVFKLAFKGIGDAVEALASKDPQAIAEAFGNLTPDAQRFALTIGDVQENFNILGREVQSRFLPILTDGLQRINDVILPTLNEGLLDVTDALGRVTDAAVDMVTSQDWVNDLGTIMDSNVVITENLGFALLGMLDAIRHIMVVAGPFTEWLTGLARAGAEWFAAQMAISRGNGELAAFFDRTKDALSNMISILQDVGGALQNVFAIGRDNEGGFVDSMVRAAESFRVWTDTPAGITAISEFFQFGNAVMDQLIKAFGQLWDILFGNNDDSMLLATLDRITADDGLLFHIGEISNGIDAGLGPAVVDLITAFVRFNNIMPFNPVIDLAKALANVADKILDFFEANPAIGEFAAGLVAAGIAAGLIGAVLSKVIGVARAAATVLSPPLLIIAGIAIVIKKMWDNSEAFRESLRGLGDALGRLFEPVLAAINDLFGADFSSIDAFFGELGDKAAVIVDNITAFVDAIPRLDGGAIRDAVAPIFAAAETVANGALQIGSDMVGGATGGDVDTSAVSNQGQGLGASLVQIGTNTMAFVQDLVGDFVSAFTESGVYDTMRELATNIGRLFESVVELIATIGAVITQFWDRYGSYIADALAGMFNRVVGFISNVVGAVTNVIQFVVAILTGDWQGALTAFGEFFMNIFGAIGNALLAVTGLVGTILGTIGAIIFEVLRSIWDAIGGTFETVQGVIVGAVDWMIAVFISFKDSVINAGSLMLDVLSLAFSLIGTAFGAAIDVVTGIVTGIPGVFRRVGSALSGVGRTMWDGIKNGFKNMINTIIRWWNNLSFGISGVTIDPPGPGSITIPSVSLNTPNIPTIGDTARPHGTSGSLSRSYAAHASIDAGVPGKRQITNALYGAYAGSDHPAGRAFDLQGDNLNAYAKRLRDAGGFAEFHGSGSGRHLHGVYGDTNMPRRQLVADTAPTASIDTQPREYNFNFPNATDRREIEYAIRSIMNDEKINQRER